MIKTAVIGHPIGHSKSPLIHNYWLQKYGIDGHYDALDIKPQNLAKDLPLLFTREGYKGVNLTLPHKEIALEICDEIDALGQKIGAVNTVTYENGLIKGTNTDAYGFITNIKQTLPNFDFTAGPAYVLGAGGAAKAIIYGLLQEGVPSIYCANRTFAKAQHLENIDPKITAIPWEERSNLKSANMLVNTTSLGMNGQPDLEIDISHLPSGALVTDIVYAPLMTSLLKSAKENGNPLVTGIGMLLHQARPGFKLWNGILPDVTQELETKVLAP